MKSTYCTAISKSDDISPEKDISATIHFFITIRRDNPEKDTLSFGYSPKKGGGAAQIDFDLFLKAENVAKLENLQISLSLKLVTPVTPAGAVQLANWGPELAPASVLTFTWKLFGSLRPPSDRLLGCRYGRQVAELNLRPGAGTTCQPIWTSAHFPKIWSWSICCRILKQKSIHYTTEL